MWLSGINSDGEMRKKVAKVRGVSLNGCIVGFTGIVQTLDRCDGQYGMGILNLLNRHQYRN